MKTIFNTYIEVESQEQADRLKQVCVENGLPIWEDENAFKSDCFFNIFNFIGSSFWISASILNNTQVTEAEWMELLKKYKS